MVETVEEIKTITRETLKACKLNEKPNLYWNALGIEKQLPSRRQACSFVWTGFEAWIMVELLKRLQEIQPGALKAYIYDGFWSSVRLSDEQINDLESHILRRSKEHLGAAFAIRLKARPFASEKRSPTKLPNALSQPVTPPRRDWSDLSHLHIDKARKTP